jgi:NADPH:quinone reductase-like Zn-dependent oxidoreductase
MNAVQISKHGGVEVLEYVNISKPVPKKGS